LVIEAFLLTGIHQFAPRIDTRVKGNGLNHRGSGYRHVIAPFDNSAKSQPQIPSAFCKQTRSVRVTVYARAIPQLELGRNLCGTFPRNELAFDFLALGMRANFTVGLVTP
jgi:hypothetical protein